MRTYCTGCGLCCCEVVAQKLRATNIEEQQCKRLALFDFYSTA